MFDRREVTRPGDAPRRRSPRPPLALNLALIALALLAGGVVRWHRKTLDERFSTLLEQGASAPFEIKRLTHEIAAMDLSEEQLTKELDGRLEYVESLRAQDFYLSIDTKAGKLRLQYGNDVVREASLQQGAPKKLKIKGGKTWSFTPLRGSFTIAGKAEGASWIVPEWVYVLEGKLIPTTRPAVASGLGKYVVYLPNNYVIHSPPPSGSPLKGPKPASFMVPEADLAAIWPRLNDTTRVYIF